MIMGSLKSPKSTEKEFPFFLQLLTFRVLRRIYEFVLQEKRMSPRELRPAADSQEPDRKRRYL